MNIIRGTDRRPFAEVEGHEDSTESGLTKFLKLSALGYVGIKGFQFAAENATVRINPERLSYLHQGLSTLDNPWWRVAGLKEDPDGRVHARLRDFMLEGIKRGEEMLGGMPRTFGAFGFFSRGAFTSSGTTLRISPTDIKGAEDHYRALIRNAGATIEPGDLLRGFIVQPHEGKPALFRLTPGGQPAPTPLVKNVDVSVRRWLPEGVPDRYKQIVRSSDLITESMGARRISRENPFPFLVSKPRGQINITGTTRELLEDFTNVDALQQKISAGMSERTHRTLRDVNIVAKRMTERYMRMLDAPLEFYEELLYGGPTKERGLLKKAQEHSAYGFFKNIFGAGGDYSGSVADVWARHAGRAALAGIALAGTYEVGSMATNLLFDRDLAQVGGEVLGATQRTYAGASDLVGLTALNKYQEEQAPGSGRLLGALSFGLSGWITGHTLAAASASAVTPEDEFAWRIARQEVHDSPWPFKSDKKITRGARWGRIGGAAGLAAGLPFLLGALGSSQSYEEVLAEQRGETEVAVRKGAHWEMQRTDIEGERIQYHRPGWYRRLQDDAFDELQHGDMGDRPLSRFLKGLWDPYWREKELFYDRPYGITGPDTTGFGPLGTLWGATIGRVLKAPRYMHAEEMSSGGLGGATSGDIIGFGDSLEGAPDASLGGLGPSEVVSPYSGGFLAGEAAYKATEAVGLPGFVFSSIKERLTGESDFGTQSPVLSSFAEMGSIRDNFWDLNIGGGFGSTEAFRRFVPSERYQLDKVNPIENQMPSWLPGAGHYNDFQRGDPYAAVPEGEYRLPGSGYASRFPELAGVNPEDYPDIHKFKILGDVAPYSREFRDLQDEMQSRAKSGSLSEREMALFRATEASVEEKGRGVRFGDHEGLVGGYWGLLKTLGRANPVEHLLPISPVHKFAGPMDPISEYEFRNIYSTEMPSWASPIDDFIMPAFRSAAHGLGWEGIPAHEEQRRALTGYFDKLEYTKYKKLEAAARSAGEGKAAFAFARKAEYTMYGADPYADIESVMKTLPREERPFFREFLAADSSADKGRILEIVPEYTRKFYLGQWQKQIYAGLAAEGDLGSEELLAVKQIEAARALEGEQASMDLWNAYQSDVESGVVRPNTFPDYIRGQRLGGYFDEESPLDAPPTDWLGYDPAVAMDDVKLKVVQNMGLDHHDFNLWHDDVAEARRKPYLDAIASDLMDSNAEDRDYLIQSLQALHINDLHVEIVPSGGDKTRVVFDIGQDRTGELRAQLEQRGFRYGV